MSEEGELVDWNDERGYGFIRTDSGQRVFVHIKSIGRIATRPRPGDRLRFDVGRGKDGRPAAVGAQILGANPLVRPRRDPEATGRPDPHERWTGGLVLRLAAALLIAGLALGAAMLGRAPDWLLWLYAGAGLLSFGNYWVDKRAALAGRWRTAEAKLLGLDLVGGIVGGLFAQVALRHKSSKPEYGLATAGIVGLHLAGLALVISGLVPLG